MPCIRPCFSSIIFIDFFLGFIGKKNILCRFPRADVVRFSIIIPLKLDIFQKGKTKERQTFLNARQRRSLGWTP